MKTLPEGKMTKKIAKNLHTKEYRIHQGSRNEHSSARTTQKEDHQTIKTTATKNTLNTNIAEIQSNISELNNQTKYAVPPNRK